MKSVFMQVFAIAFAVFAATSVQADWPLPVETRYGILAEIPVFSDPGKAGSIRDYGSAKYEFSGVELAGITGFLKVEHVFDFGPRGDVVLLRLWSGGANCCNSYRLLSVSSGGIELSEEFGMHGRDPSEFTVTEKAVSFRLERDFPSDTDHWLASFNGENILVSVFMEDDTGAIAAGPGSDVLRWQGAQSSDMMNDAGERARFRSIMNKRELTMLRDSLRLSRTLEASDGYLWGGGCWPHRCNTRQAYIAVEIETGRPYAVYRDEEGYRFFGTTEEDLVEPLLNALRHDRESTEEHQP